MSKPLFVEIKGVQFRNKGAYLMLLACLEGLKQRGQPYELVLSPGPNLPYVERARLGAWQKLSFRRGGLDLTPLIGKLPQAMQRLFNRYGMVSEAQVDLVLEASGFAYGDQWPLRFLQNTAKEVVRFAKVGKPFVFMPQAFGPFSSKESKAAMRDIIQHARLIFVRDPVSLQHLQSCVDVLPEHVVLTPDFTVGLSAEANAEVPELKVPFAALIPGIVDAVIACVGGGSNAIGMFADFIAEQGVKLIGVEPGGKGINTHQHGAALSTGSYGILHGAYTAIMQTSDGQIEESYSISAGLDYPAVGPQHTHLQQIGRAEYVAINDDEALAAFQQLAKSEGIIPALESSHALAHAIKMAAAATEPTVLLVNLSGRGDKDVAQMMTILGDKLD